MKSRLLAKRTPKIQLDLTWVLLTRLPDRRWMLDRDEARGIRACACFGKTNQRRGHRWREGYRRRYIN